MRHDMTWPCVVCRVIALRLIAFHLPRFPHCPHTHVCICACVYVCMCACVHVCMCACVHVCMCACVHVCVCVHVWCVQGWEEHRSKYLTVLATAVWVGLGAAYGVFAEGWDVETSLRFAGTAPVGIVRVYSVCACVCLCICMCKCPNPPVPLRLSLTSSLTPHASPFPLRISLTHSPLPLGLSLTHPSC